MADTHRGLQGPGSAWQKAASPVTCQEGSYMDLSSMRAMSLLGFFSILRALTTAGAPSRSPTSRSRFLRRAAGAGGVQCQARC